jgi:hypothetical protein
MKITESSRCSAANFHYTRVEVERAAVYEQKETRFAATVCGFNFIPWRSRSYLTDEMSAPQLRSLQQSYTTRLLSGAHTYTPAHNILCYVDN